MQHYPPDSYGTHSNHTGLLRLNPVMENGKGVTVVPPKYMRNIPNTLFQTSIEKPEQYVVGQFMAKCPGWNYLHFNDEEIIRFFRENPIAEFKDIIQRFHSIKNGPNKADLFRYYYLYVNGGVFVDSDAMLEEDINNIVKDYYFFTVNSFSENLIFQGFIGCSPRHNFMYKALCDVYYIDMELLERCPIILCHNLYNILTQEYYNNNFFGCKIYSQRPYNNKSTEAYDEYNNTLLLHHYADKVIPRKEIVPIVDYKLQEHLYKISQDTDLPDDHIQYLYRLKAQGFEPKVIYDIGSCVLKWAKYARQVWPNARIILFEAFDDVEFLYKDYDYNIGVLSNVDDNMVKFYQNEYLPAGNSYYREVANPQYNIYPEDKYVVKKTNTLDTVVRERGFPPPDFIKIDVQGSELDVLAGGQNTIRMAKRMIIELQHIEYNLGAKLSDESLEIIEGMGWTCNDPLFCNNGPDGDYGFIRSPLNIVPLNIAPSNIVPSNIAPLNIAPLNIALFNGFKFHYEMFGYIIHYCKTKQHRLTIYCDLTSDLGYINFFKWIFGDYYVEYKQISSEFDKEKYMYDVLILTTDDDAHFKTNDPIINAKTICIDHYCMIRTPILPHHVAVRPFPKEFYREWALPIYPILTPSQKREFISYDGNNIHVAIVGGGSNYKVDIINRLRARGKRVVIHAISRKVKREDFTGIHSSIELYVYKNIPMDELLNILYRTNYILSDSTTDIDHIADSMRGSIPLAFSILTPLIIEKETNSYYQFKNVIEFDKLSMNDIMLEDIDIGLLERERDSMINKNMCVFDSKIQAILGGTQGSPYNPLPPFG